jgi:hypothetical protein
MSKRSRTLSHTVADTNLSSLHKSGRNHCTLQLYCNLRQIDQHQVRQPYYKFRQRKLQLRFTKDIESICKITRYKLIIIECFGGRRNRWIECQLRKLLIWHLAYSLVWISVTFKALGELCASFSKFLEFIHQSGSPCFQNFRTEKLRFVFYYKQIPFSSCTQWGRFPAHNALNKYSASNSSTWKLKTLHGSCQMSFYLFTFSWCCSFRQF